MIVAESLKLEAMKRIIGMLARGRDVGALFPAVVKNVVSKNTDLKPLGSPKLFTELFTVGFLARV